MTENIKKQLDIVESSINWIRNFLDGEKQKNAYRSMVNKRRSLNKKMFAISDNPAITVYGESQVGKSYLISSLLSEEGSPFSITDKEGNVHNFIDEINPIGGGTEATSLVSRFSVNYIPKNTSFPVKAYLLSPADIVLVLCDTYFTDIQTEHNQILQTEQINSEINSLVEQLDSRLHQQSIFIEDHVLDIEDYFKEYLSNNSSNLLYSNFFEKISLVISKTKPSEWKDIFSYLWNKNEKFTELFNILILEYEKLNFSNTIFLPLESVLRKYGTLLDVERLKEIYAAPNIAITDYVADTTVLFFDNKQESQVRIKKSYLCALTAELVFHQKESLLISKSFMKESDLLDFPGRRARDITMPEKKIKKENIPELMIRGKIAYLFNKYSVAGKINIFMLCAKHGQPASRSMPIMLNKWVNEYIDDTPEKREKFIENSKIPPLFIVGTFFNVNLEYDPSKDKKTDHSSLNYRWRQRFERSLTEEVIDTNTYQWFNNWTITSPNFQNIYLLRDFHYSDVSSQIFKGYSKDKKELEEIIPQDYPEFRQDLRKSFIEYDFVKRHFANPAESWDEAATINKDGTSLIIEKLTIAAANINKARLEKTITELNEISQHLLAELLKYFHSNDKDEELQKAKKLAGEIQFKLDKAFSADGIKLYGLMMKEFMLSESKVLEIFRKKIDDIEHRNVKNTDTYSTYRIQVPVIESDTPDSYFERLCKHYEKISEEQKQQFREELDKDKIDLEELIKGNTDLIKSNAQQLANTLIDFWLDDINLSDKHITQQILAQEGSSSLQDIREMYQKLFKKVSLSQKIADKVRKYITDQNKSELPYEMVADMSAELLNKCINTVGFDYFDESEREDLRLANEKNNLGLNLNHFGNPTEKSIAELFERIDNWTDIIQENPEEMKSLPSYRGYLSWYNRLKIGFVSVCDIPNYDVNANEKLGVIIKETETIKYT